VLAAAAAAVVVVVVEVVVVVVIVTQYPVSFCHTGAWKGHLLGGS